MLAALGRDVNAHGRKHARKAAEDGLCHRGRRPTADLMADDLARAAADNDDLSAMQARDLCKLLRSAGSLLLHLRDELMIFYFVYDSCHTYPFPFKSGIRQPASPSPSRARARSQG